MLKKFCDNCSDEMPLDSGYEFSYGSTTDLPRLHVCSWLCLNAHIDKYHAQIEDFSGQKVGRQDILYHPEIVKRLDR